MQVRTWIREMEQALTALAAVQERLSARYWAAVFLREASEGPETTRALEQQLAVLREMGALRDDAEELVAIAKRLVVDFGEQAASAALMSADFLQTRLAVSGALQRLALRGSAAAGSGHQTASVPAGHKLLQ